MIPDSCEDQKLSTPYTRIDLNDDCQNKGQVVFQRACAFILIVELAERLCYYTLAGSQEFFLEQVGYSVQQSAGINSAFSTICYMWPLLGGYVADCFLGKYATILFFASTYAFGGLLCCVAALPGSLRSTPIYLLGSMGLVAFGTGGIKPNISNFGADQYDISSAAGKRAQEAFYTQFYVAINLGALVAYGGLTTLCSSGGPLIPKQFGYFAGYGIGTLAMCIAVFVFACHRTEYVRKPPRGDALRGVVLHVISAASRGSRRGLAIVVGCPTMLIGLLLSILVSFKADFVIVGFAFGALLIGMCLVGWGCHSDLAWVHGAARNVYVTRQQTVDFLRIMPTLITVNLAFNALYNPMNFWYQQQACQMDLQVAGFQLSGSFFNVADCCAIVLMTPVILNQLNPCLDRLLGGFTRHEKLLTGCALASASTLLSAWLEVKRRSSPLLEQLSDCAPPGVKMSSLSAWWMVGPYALMGVAEVYVNPALYYLAYSQTPLRLRSTSQAVGLVLTSVSSGLFTVITPFLGASSDLNKAHLEYGYFASLLLALPFLVAYFIVQGTLEEKDFDSFAHLSDDSDNETGDQFKEVTYSKMGFFKGYLSPRSPAGSPAGSECSSPIASPRLLPDSPPFDSIEDEINLLDADS